jgi:hypothetical protein
MKEQRRFTFLREGLCFGLAERDAAGAMEYWIQESGEVRWYPFVPTPAEETAVKRLFEKPPAGGWPML